MKLAGLQIRFYAGQALIRGSGLALLSLLVLGGCASKDESVPEWAGVKGVNDPAILVDFRETAKFKVRWHSNVGDPGANPLQPALIADAVYGASGKGRLTRLDRATGKQLWKIETGIMVSAGVASGDGLVLVGGNKGDVLAYAGNGDLRWKIKVSSEVLNVSSVVDGVVIVRSGDGRIAGLDASDGKRLWLYERSTPALVVRSHAGVVIQRGVAYAGFAGGRIAAINIKSGEVLWENFVSQPRGNTELERISDITSDPVVDDEQVCAIAFQGYVACFDIVQGGPLWHREISSDKGLMLLRKYIYLTDVKGYVIALDKTSGSTVWKNDQLFMRGNTTPYVMGDFVLVGDFEGFLHGMNREDGSFVARTQLDSVSIKVAPVQMDDGILVQMNNGELYSLSVQ